MGISQFSDSRITVSIDEKLWSEYTAANYGSSNLCCRQQMILEGHDSYVKERNHAVLAHI